jgi:hypothetical protein
VRVFGGESLSHSNPFACCSEWKWSAGRSVLDVIPVCHTIRRKRQSGRISFSCLSPSSDFLLSEGQVQVNKGIHDRLRLSLHLPASSRADPLLCHRPALLPPLSSRVPLVSCFELTFRWLTQEREQQYERRGRRTYSPQHRQHEDDGIFSNSMERMDRRLSFNGEFGLL